MKLLPMKLSDWFKLLTVDKMKKFNNKLKTDLAENIYNNRKSQPNL